MSKAAIKVRTLLAEKQTRMTFAHVRQAIPDLLESEISMALCYLLRKNQVTRQQVPNTHNKGRKLVWEYEFITQGAKHEQDSNQVPQG